MHSNFAIAKAVASKKARLVTKFLFEDVILVYMRAPTAILTDNAKSFVSAVVTELNTMLCIKGINTIPYTPHTNGLCERLNGILANMLAHYTNKNQSNWAKLVKPICFAYNALPHATTNISPCKAMFGYDPVTPMQVNMQSLHNDAIFSDLRLIKEEVEKYKGHKFLVNKCRYDANRRLPDFKKGDLVKVVDYSIATDHKQKLAFRFLGLFKVIEVVSPVLLCLNNRKKTLINVDKIYH